MGVEIVDEAVRVAPAAPLRGLVGWYSGYRQRGVPATRHRGLPSPWLTLILTLDRHLSLATHPAHLFCTHSLPPPHHPV